jgi:hypothetical protein
VLDFAPDGGLTSADADLRRLARTTDPVQVCALFTEYAGGAPATGEQLAVLREVVEAATAEAGA